MVYASVLSVHIVTKLASSTSITNKLCPISETCYYLQYPTIFYIFLDNINNAQDGI